MNYIYHIRLSDMTHLYLMFLKPFLIRLNSRARWYLFGLSFSFCFLFSHKTIIAESSELVSGLHKVQLMYSLKKEMCASGFHDLLS